MEIIVDRRKLEQLGLAVMNLALRPKRRGREKGGLFFSLRSSGKTEWEWTERMFLVLYWALP